MDARPPARVLYPPPVAGRIAAIPLTIPTPSWTPYIYSTSQPPERGFRLSLPSHRGREAIAYLTFIIDNYAALPSYTAFIHAGATQRHNDILGPYTAPILQNLRFDSVDRLGYLNLRCTLEPGCPIGVNPLEPTQTDIEGGDIRAYFADVYMELFDVPASAVPKHVGGVCCGQFVVSRERIRARPRNDYERMRRWALESTVTDSFGVGWTFEKVWQVVFGMGDTYCPSFEECKCDLLGWCGPIPETCRVDGRDALPEALRVR